MNARQRRKDKKLWRYKVVTIANNYDHYTEMWEWLKARHGSKIHKCGWRDRVQAHGPDDEYRITWQFTRQLAAAEFALRWA